MEGRAGQWGRKVGVTRWALGAALLAACSSNQAATRPTPLQTTSPAGLPATAAGLPTPLGPDAVRGSVVDEFQRPVGGRVVAIQGMRVTTDADGGFALAAAPAVYDVVVTEPDATRATVYRGLRRRDVVLVHTPGHGPRGPAHRATITGRVEGGPFAGADSANVSFASPQASGQTFLGGGGGARPGPEFGPLVILWEGPGTISGDVTATHTHADPLDPGDAGGRRRPWDPTVRLTASLAQQHVTLRDGDTLTVDLAPVPMPRLRTQVQLGLPQRVHPTQVFEVYGFRSSHGTVAAGGAPLDPHATTFDLDIVDARSLGGTLCAFAAYGYGQLLWTRACDLPVDRPVSVALHAAPSLGAPASGAAIRPDTTFSWSATDGAVFELELRDRSPTATAPAVDVYTTGTSTTWPDLHGLGVAFPAGSAGYEVKIAARGPYATLDDAVGPEGMGAPFPAEKWLAAASPVELHVEPPLPVGPEEALCQYPYMTSIVCGDIPDNIEQRKEFYMLAAINNKLRHFPQFANAVGIHCVRDCAGARAYMKAHAEYAKAHPGFDANEPLEMNRAGGPPPPP